MKNKIKCLGFYFCFVLFQVILHPWPVLVTDDRTGNSGNWHRVLPSRSCSIPRSYPHLLALLIYLLTITMTIYESFDSVSAVFEPHNNYVQGEPRCLHFNQKVLNFCLLDIEMTQTLYQYINKSKK